MKKNYVIGDSISALSFAFYNPNFTLITTGKEKKDIPFVFVQDNKYARRLVYDIGLEIEIESVRISPVSHADNVVIGKGIPNAKDFIGTDRIANVGRDLLLRAIKVKESTICKEILKRISERTVVAKVLAITEEIITIDVESEIDKLEYNELVYTEHFNKFKSAAEFWDPGDEYQMFDVGYASKSYEKGVGSSITYKDKGDVVKVVNNSITESAGMELKNWNVERPNHFVLKDARFTGRIAPPPKDTIFLGRSATANAHWRIEDSLFVAQEGYSFCKMLYEQYRFDYHLQRITDNTGQERLAGLVLHAYSELAELLREMNWKMNESHRDRVATKATSVLEEGTDVIKLMWSIFYYFQYTPREISEMFWDKSERVWGKMLDGFCGGV